MTTQTNANPIDRNATTTTTNNNNAKETAMPTQNNDATNAASTTTTSILPTTPALPNAGLAALVQQISAEIDAAEAALGPEPAVTTSIGKRRTGKPRKGAEKVLAQLAPIVAHYKLESPALSATEMVTLADRADILVPLQIRLKKLTKRIDDEIFNDSTQAWSMGLQFYTLLQRRAKKDGGLAAVLAPIAKAFSYRRPAAKTSPSSGAPAPKPTKVELRAQADLKKAEALAAKHGFALKLVPFAPATAPSGTEGSATPPSASPPAAPQPASNGAGPVAAPVTNGTAPSPVSGAAH
jgi:hypothetical protein